MEPTLGSTRPKLRPWVVLVKRLVRKSIRWYVRPQFDEILERLDQTAKQADLDRHEERLVVLENAATAALIEIARLHQRVAQVESDRSQIQASSLAHRLQLDQSKEGASPTEPRG